MKRSQVNEAYRQAVACFARTGWTLPPEPKWDITDYGLGDFRRHGLILVNLAEEPEYCEKLIYARQGQITPMHAHRKKKEDIICRWGRLELELWPAKPEDSQRGREFAVPVNGRSRSIRAGDPMVLNAGERVTITPGIYHAFRPESPECVIGEVSTANDDLHDNFFVDPRIGRFPKIEEDETAEVRLVGE